MPRITIDTPEPELAPDLPGTYRLTAAFLAYLEATRPGLVAAAALQVGDVVPIKVGRPGARCRLDFPGKPHHSLFDRAFQTDDMCIVLDAHPDSYGPAALTRIAPTFAVGEQVCRVTDVFRVVDVNGFYVELVSDGGDTLRIDRDEERIVGKFTRVAPAPGA